MISVIMTTYNAWPLVKDAITALQLQTYRDFEIIIIDDQSSDDTYAQLSLIADRDPRIKVILNSKKGRGFALNLGLQHASGEWIAINDADDISTPDRLAKQHEFLIQNPPYGMVGSQFKIHELQTGQITSSDHPLSNEDLRLGLTKYQVLQHSTVMFRRATLDQAGGYDTRRDFLFDRDIFIRTAKISKIANLPDVLVTIARHPQQYFYHRFSNRRREIEHQRLRIKALRTFNYPWYRRISPWISLGVAWLRLNFLKALIPPRWEAKIRSYLYPS